MACMYVYFNNMCKYYVCECIKSIDLTSFKFLLLFAIISMIYHRKHFMSISFIYHHPTYTYNTLFVSIGSSMCSAIFPLMLRFSERRSVKVTVLVTSDRR